MGESEENQEHYITPGARTTKLVVTIAFLVLLPAPWVLAQMGSGSSGTATESVAGLPGQKDSCVECHAQIEGQLGAPTAAMQNDIHQQRGLSCADCHGGDRSNDDPLLAMDPRKGFVAKPAPKDVPRFCGKCHSNPEFMKRFNPALRVDQEAEYATSVHGKRAKQGDQTVATCTSCHGYHGVKAVSDGNAPVYPLNVAHTCGKCHANAEYMRSYSIPTDQLEKYSNSVHAVALTKKQDLSAPTCNDCHGNHGAAPPGVTSVANICGTCHTRQSDLFQKSVHKAPFEAVELAGCVVCHSNHEIQSPTDEMLGVGEKATCTSCHVEGDAGYQAAQTMRGMIDELVGRIDDAQQVLAKAARAGMEVSKPIFQLRESQDKLINARVVVHSFSPGDFETAVNPGLEVAKGTHQAGLDALGELQFRRKGLAVSLIVIFLAVVGVYLKIREIESRG
jgi:predicted CXXCH cytochrome family protein